MNIDQVIERYAEQRANPRQGGAVEWRAGNVFCVGPAIYSYGFHFPMAYYLGKERGESLFLLNGDRYSSSTSGHQAGVRSACPGFTVAFSALRSAGVDASAIELADVIDRTPDVFAHLERDNAKSPWRRTEGGDFEVPKVGEVRVSGKPDEYQSGYFHAPGAALLRSGKRRLLCTTDEGTYCVMELRGNPRTVAEAFESLKPAVVRGYEEHGEAVRRQGEWYFIPCLPPEGRSKAQQIALPRRNDAGNLHVCVGLLKPHGIFAKGNVYHRNERGRRTGQHRTLPLGAQWHLAYRNTERGSWTAGGRVD